MNNRGLIIAKGELRRAKITRFHAQILKRIMDVLVWAAIKIRDYENWLSYKVWPEFFEDEGN